MGDRILKVNGTDVTKATHQEAVIELLRPGDEIVLTVQHDPLPIGFQVSTSNLKQSNVNLIWNEHGCTYTRHNQLSFFYIHFAC